MCQMLHDRPKRNRLSWPSTNHGTIRLPDYDVDDNNDDMIMSTREEVGCGGNEDVKMDEWSHQAGQN